MIGAWVEQLVAAGHGEGLQIVTSLAHADRRLPVLLVPSEKRPEPTDGWFRLTASGLVLGDGLPDPSEPIFLPALQGFIGLGGLVAVVDRLLGPGGCPWDQAQTHDSLKRHLLEEAYELIDAIEARDDARMQEELGDVLLQPIMHAQMRALAGGWSTQDVAQTIVNKLVRRHPHVFGDVEANDAETVLRNWDAIKKSEKGEEASILGGVPRAMAALHRAHEISKRAARIGFEWPNLESVFAKCEEEIAELREAIGRGHQQDIESEIGDLLFTLVNVARWLKVEPEEAQRKMVDRFTLRFERMESAATKPLRDLTPEEWDTLWNASKAAEQG